MNQRRLNRIGSFRSPDEIIDTRAYEVAELLDDNTPKAFVEQHHYSGSYPAARARFGLYCGAQLAGPAQSARSTSVKISVRGCRAS
jgi:hypothetical protein